MSSATNRVVHRLPPCVQLPTGSYTGCHLDTVRAVQSVERSLPPTGLHTGGHLDTVVAVQSVGRPLLPARSCAGCHRLPLCLGPLSPSAEPLMGYFCSAPIISVKRVA